tara:strand:+ start:1327 stop:2472 length:1146 start_codon:yes stop_codon:yes gene_type:complete
MSVTRTFTVTVAYVYGGNKYLLDGVAQADAYLVEGNTYRFDQSDSSNGGHPLRFSTTSNGTHSGGSEYTTGVTTNGTPGNAGAYTEITVASDAPTLYYYCTNHSGMGGTAYTPSEGWDVGAWGAGRYGVANEFTLGWGAKNWDSSGSWGDMGDETITPTGFSLTSSLGSVSVSTEINTGWGRQPWNENAWGIAGDVLLDGQSATTSVGSLVVGDILGLTGQSATTSVGSPTIIGDITATLTGQSATASVGSIDIAGQIVGLTGQSITSSVGSISPADAIGVTGVSATTSLGTASTNSNPTISVTGVSATSAIGSLSPADVMGLTGISSTASVGSLTPADVMGLTGVSATTSVAGFGTSSGFGIQAYQAIDTGSNTTYSNVA